MNKVHDNIRRIRESKGLKQSDIAKKLKMAVNNYSLIERGEIKLTVDRLYEIAGILKTSISDILDSENVEKNQNEKKDLLEYKNRYSILTTEIVMFEQTIKRYYKEGKGLVFLHFDFVDCKLQGVFKELKKKVTEEDLKELYGKEIDFMITKYNKKDKGY